MHKFIAHYALEINLFNSLKMLNDVFNDVLIMNQDQVRCFTTKVSSAECTVMCRRG
jgi:hypothetical protein